MGGFAGLFDLKQADISDPILVAATDGVGSKLELTRQSGKAAHYRQLGIDLVAMAANDVLAVGATPLFFLDYIATDAIEGDRLYSIVAGVADGCVLAGARLIGGETAEMPGVYPKGGFDLAGFCVGAVARQQQLTKAMPKAGDVAIAIGSAGVHANGFSLVRKILADQNLAAHAPAPFASKTIAEAFLTPTAIYADAILPLVKQGLITSAAHITGGGLVNNPPRVFGDDLALSLDMATWKMPRVFAWLQKVGGLGDMEMLRVFNCGVGMVVTAHPTNAEKVLASIASSSQHRAWRIGQLVKRRGTDAAPVAFQGLADWAREVW